MLTPRCIEIQQESMQQLNKNENNCPKPSQEIPQKPRFQHEVQIHFSYRATLSNLTELNVLVML